MLTTNEKIGRIVKTLREEENWSQSVLAKELGIQTRAINQMEKGNITPSVKNLEVIAKLFKKPLKYFFDFNHIKITATDEERISAINEDLLTANSEQLQLIQRLIKSVVYKK